MIDKFIEKYKPNLAVKEHDQFERDLYRLCSNQNKYQSVCVDVLSSINAAELLFDNDETYGRVSFFKKENKPGAYILQYSPAYGLEESDYRELLRMLAEAAIKK